MLGTRNFYAGNSEFLCWKLGISMLEIKRKPDFPQNKSLTKLATFTLA